MCLRDLQSHPRCVRYAFETLLTYCSECNIRRAMIDLGRLIVVRLSEDRVPKAAQVRCWAGQCLIVVGVPEHSLLSVVACLCHQLFGNVKCASADQPGRWIDIDSIDNVCKPPYCTGPTRTTIHDEDWVRDIARCYRCWCS